MNEPLLLNNNNKKYLGKSIINDIIYNNEKLTDPASMQIYENSFFSHYHPIRRLWEYIILYVSSFPIFELGVFFFFDELVLPIGLVITLIIFDILMFIDVFVYMATPLLFRGYQISFEDKSKVIICISILSFLPYYLIGILLKSKILYGCLFALKMLRIIRTVISAKTIFSSCYYSNSYSRLIPLFLMFFIFIHITSLYYFSLLLSSDYYDLTDFSVDSKFKRYVVCFYFILTTVYAIGFGDITPHMSHEVVNVVAIQVVGVIVNTCIVGVMTSILLDHISTSFISDYQCVSSFIRFKEIENQFRTEITNYYQLNLEQYGGVNTYKEAKNDFPEKIMKQLNEDVYIKCISKIYFIRNGSNKLRFVLSEILKPVIFVPNQVIIQKDEIKDEMLLLNSGTISISINNSVICTQGCSDGVVFGEENLFLNKKRETTIKATTYVEGCIISRSDLIKCLSEWKDVSEELLGYLMVLYPKNFQEIKSLFSKS